MEGQAFRPSPNFKHMKKYQKAKAYLSTAVEEPTPATPISPVEEPEPAEPAVEPPPPPEVKQEPCASQPFEDQPPQLFENQPPLPPDIKPPLIDFKPPLCTDMYAPPLPVNPPPVDIKEEMQETEIQYMEPQMQYMDYEPTTSAETETNEIMCRNYFRGACHRGSSCLYSHRVIVSQLKDVYRFCNDFQNSVCKRPTCRFVHASVFEKENFLRTGYLPPHTMSHFHEPISVLPPPPPPPPPQEPVADVNQFYTLMPPPPPPPPVTECVQVPKDPMMMYAPGPSGYQVPKQHPYQRMETHQMQAMQASKKTPVQTMDTSSPSTSHHVMQAPMQAPMQASLHPMQAAQMQIPVPSVQSSIPPPQIPMQAPLQAMRMPIQAATQPPPPLQPDMSRPPPNMNCPPPVNIYATPKPEASSSSSPWPQTESSPSTSYENVAETETTCASCEINDFRLKYTMNKNEKLRRENEEMNREIAEIDLKKQLIFIFLAKILDSNKSWTNKPGMQNERQRVLMEQLQKFLSSGQL